MSWTDLKVTNDVALTREEYFAIDRHLTNASVTDRLFPSLAQNVGLPVIRDAYTGVVRASQLA